MESLATASEILSQLSQLTDGMAVICQAVNAFQQDWGQLKGFANLPWCLTGRVNTPLASPTGAGSTHVKGSNLVCSTTKDFWDFPRLIAPVPDLISETKRCSNEDGPSTRYVACL